MDFKIKVELQSEHGGVTLYIVLVGLNSGVELPFCLAASPLPNFHLPKGINGREVKLYVVVVSMAILCKNYFLHFVSVIMRCQCSVKPPWSPCISKEMQKSIETTAHVYRAPCASSNAPPSCSRRRGTTRRSPSWKNSRNSSPKSLRCISSWER